MTNDWQEYDGPWYIYEDDPLYDGNYEHKDSFTDMNDSTAPDGKPLVGVQVRLESGEEYLVGDINKRTGSCDCCSEFYRTAIVVAWRRVYDPTEDDI